MKAYCYIIFSSQLNRFYIGACHNDLKTRIKNHNTGGYGKHRFTSTANDWELFLTISANDYSHAVRIEKHIKTMKSSKYIRNLKLYPESLDNVIQTTGT